MTRLSHDERLRRNADEACAVWEYGAVVLLVCGLAYLVAALFGAA